MTVVAVPSSLHAEWEGRTVWFCGEGCRRAFLENPGNHAAAS
jgi:xanthine dehydrogenase accessory factor